ncbi:hypothetical protein BC831DRAFT_452865 [Entophlyctis helioformis]|nr:hypothetical protein BC831DRAFT_452865 [Entophlyctis helioformis]
MQATAAAAARTATAARAVGELLCQKDAYARSLDTLVVSCVAAPAPAPAAPAASPAASFHVVLADTLLFPTGGGQPHDTGSIAGFPVLEVFRRGLDCVHTVAMAEPFAHGQPVRVLLDWDRRFDHMQQHSGQHLLSAIAASEFNLQTYGWGLGKDKSFFELTAEPKDGVLLALEQRVNDIIRQPPDSLPDDLTSGVVRYISIGDLDRNANTADIQARVRGGNCRVFFAAGNRVFKLFQTSLDRDRQLTAVLSTGCTFVDRVEGLKRQIKDLMKTAKKQTKEIKDLQAAAASAGAANSAATDGTKPEPSKAAAKADQANTRGGRGQRPETGKASAVKGSQGQATSEAAKENTAQAAEPSA